jgi:hypothetical protein
MKELVKFHDLLIFKDFVNIDKFLSIMCSRGKFRFFGRNCSFLVDFTSTRFRLFEHGLKVFEHELKVQF